MRKFVAFSLAIALTFCGFIFLPISEQSFAYANIGSPQSLVLGKQSNLGYYYYYSDFYFKDGGSTSLAVGKTKTLNLQSPDGPVTWKSSNNRVVSVSANGVIKAKQAGVAVVTAHNVRVNRSVTCTVKTFKTTTQAQARKALLALKSKYRPGRTWTNKSYYFWNAANCHCYGCIAFAGIASDAVFGKYAPFSRHASFKKIKVGDHVRVGGKHSVVVLYKKRTSIVVAEGNYKKTINWGRKISKKSLARQGFYVETRY